LTAGEKSQALVAEGAGTTPQEALKDAFREAVQQVVGIVVDAETLIRDDELIKDKVLTYSDGFITKYEKLDETQRGGLVRIKISAVVERRSLVQKLKAANVTVKAFDGSGLFAEVVTQIEAKQNSEALIRKALADLPGLLTAEVDGKPDFNKETSEITVRVRVHVDQTAYSEFVKRLEDVLKKVCISHSSTLLKGEQDRLPWPMICEHHPALAGPAVKNNSQWGIWVNTFNSESHTSLRWNGYVVDCDPQAIVQSLEAPSVTEYHYSRGQISQDTITRASDAKTLLSIVALNANGKLVTEDQIELVCDQESTYRSDSSSEGPKPFLRHFYPRLLDDTGHVSNFRSTTVTQWLEQRNKNATVNLYIAPYSFTIKESGDDWSAIYQPQRVIERRIKVTLDELKAISHIQCKLSWNPAK
jgi:hypothetical protein